MRQDLRVWREERLAQLKREEIELASKQYLETMSWLRIDESEQMSVFDAMSDEGARFPGTSGWILKTSNVKMWLQRKPEAPLLWLHGNPGSGKTTLLTQLINFHSLTGSIVVRHFCTYSYPSSTKYDYIVRSLLLQLLRSNSELLAHVYNECILGKKPPAISTFEQLLQMVVLSMSNEPRETEYVWMVLDGLDECTAEAQRRLLSLLRNLTLKASSNGGTVCKVLVSGRAFPSTYSLKSSQEKHIVSLTDYGKELTEAIRKYASQRLQSLGEAFHQLELAPDEVEDMERKIAHKSDGMFLYARLLLDYLTTNIFYSGEEILESIHQLPTTLADFYHKILTQILARLDSRSVDRIRCLLGWVSFAKRPLKRFEILSALSFGSGGPKVRMLAPQHILDKCIPLLSERRDTTLTFIHGSVKEFLQASTSNLTIKQEDVLHEHGMAVVSCLISGLEVFCDTYDDSARGLRLVKGIHAFHVYATEFWVDYLLASAASGGLQPSSRLYLLVEQLTERLDNRLPKLSNEAVLGTESDRRLDLLQSHGSLCNHVARAIKARSKEHLEHNFFKKNGRYLCP